MGRTLQKIIVKEALAKNVLVKSKLADYCVNPYSGCGHACAYCYVPAMPWNRGKAQDWGKTVTAKTNAAEVLKKEIGKARKGTVMLSSATDAWQPIEEKYCITRKCVAVLAEADWPITALTKSDLVLRDIDLLKKFSDATIGLTISTNREDVAAVLEPGAVTPLRRIAALAQLKKAGLKTFAFVGPLLPMDCEKLVDEIAGSVDFVFIDCLNYASEQLKAMLAEHCWTECLDKELQEKQKKLLKSLFEQKGVTVKLLF